MWERRKWHGKWSVLGLESPTGLPDLPDTSGVYNVSKRVK